MRQSVQTQMHEVQTEFVDIPGTQLRVSRVALGTWAMPIRSGPSSWRPCNDPDGSEPRS
jgi:hypothetical protein